MKFCDLKPGDLLASETLGNQLGIRESVLITRAKRIGSDIEITGLRLWGTKDQGRTRRSSDMILRCDVYREGEMIWCDPTATVST